MRGGLRGILRQLHAQWDFNVDFGFGEYPDPKRVRLCSQGVEFFLSKGIQSSFLLHTRMYPLYMDRLETEESTTGGFEPQIIRLRGGHRDPWHNPERPKTHY